MGDRVSSMEKRIPETRFRVCQMLALAPIFLIWMAGDFHAAPA
jgi:hypothetical protein